MGLQPGVSIRAGFAGQFGMRFMRPSFAALTLS